MKRLVESWIRAEREYHGKSVAAAIRRMNGLHGTAFTHSRVSEWRRGVHVPSQLMLSAMLVRTLLWALREAGLVINETQLYRLQTLLWKEAEVNGQRGLEFL